ncbi:MAG TPA: hypothetical protein VI911_00395 [Patescibacteria group bacterium]|nr:hypothetical protein [Patescibacteria group bacterium]
MTPVEWVLIAMALAAAAGGGYMQYQAGQDAAAAEKQRAKHDADVATQQAEQERLNRRFDEAEEIRKDRRKRATMEAMYARSGVLLTGSPGEWLTAQAGTDAWNTEQKSAASRQGQNSLLDQADIIQWSGKTKAKAYEQQSYAALISATGQMAQTGAMAAKSSTKSETTAKKT